MHDLLSRHDPQYSPGVPGLVPLRALRALPGRRARGCIMSVETDGSLERGSMTAQGNDTGRRGGVAGGVVQVGIGMLALTGWWWPGIMLVTGYENLNEM